VVQTRERDRAINLAKSNPGAALEAARTITNPYSRCQALAWVARFTLGDAASAKVAIEAARAAEGATDPYEAVAAVAWAIRALLERSREADAEPILRQATARARQIPNPTNRVDALFLLVQAGWPNPSKAWSAAVEQMAQAASAAPGTKPQSVLRGLVLMLAGAERPYEACLKALPEGKYRRQAEERLERREFTTPRPFFW
jgi:hypothetical protein